MPTNANCDEKVARRRVQLSSNIQDFAVRNHYTGYLIVPNRDSLIAGRCDDQSCDFYSVCESNGKSSKCVCPESCVKTDDPGDFN